jgi:hypothetical protein
VILSVIRLKSRAVHIAALFDYDKFSKFKHQSNASCKMSRSWFVEHKGKTIGPMSSAQLKQLVSTSKIRRQTRVRLGDDGEWVAASSVQGLFPTKETASAVREPTAAASAPPPVPDVASVQAALVPSPVSVQQPSSQGPYQPGAPQVRGASDQPQKTGTGGFFRAFGITSGFMAAIAIAVVGLPILACGGCLGMAVLFAPSEKEMERMRVEREARETARAEAVATDSTSTTTPKPVARIAGPTMTKATYANVREGMTYEQVVAIVGPPGQELSSNEIGGFRTVMYQWEAGFMANANMTFQNGKLVAKAQFGL